MAVTADQLHQTGLDEIDRLEQRAVELGAQLGLHGLEAVNDALRASAGAVPGGRGDARRPGGPCAGRRNGRPKCSPSRCPAHAP